MSKEYLKKNSALVEGATVAQATEEELELINKYTRRKLGKDEVYVFSVVLCDNDIDRDGERFTVEALFELEKLFVGKTGIFDHNPTAKNQTARIFLCSVEAVESRKTASGDDYFRLVARAYIPISEGNKDIILALDSGIVKEVSVGCAVSEVVCSICGERIAECMHVKGESYSGKICCGEMTKPYDAYEWSFVAVPAQRSAGVIKAYESRKELSMEEIIKMLDGKNVTLSESECKNLKNYINNLKEAAKDGVYYRESLTNEVLKLSAIVQPDISRKTMESLAENMTVMQLKEFKTAFEKKRDGIIPPTVQLYAEKNNNNTVSNGQFKI